MEHKIKRRIEFSLKEELIDLIKVELPLHSIYVIGTIKEKKQQQVNLLQLCTSSQELIIYTLLIITSKPISKRLGDLMDEIYNKMEKRCRAYIINYNLSNVNKRLNYGDNFLAQAIFQTTCIYRKNNSLSKFKNYPLHFHPQVYQRIEEVWKARIERAEYLLSILNTIEPQEDSTSRLAVMHYALEQVCMGLLYVFWEFKPHHYSLAYLLHLCSNFSELPRTIFPRETYGLHRMHYMLCNAHHIMRFKDQNEFSNEDTDKAYNRCDRFLSEARDLGELKLGQLKKIHYKA